MFAIALWDARRRRLVLARDRLGIKPLYLARVPGGVAFGSEPKALLQHPAISRAPDFAAIHHYLSLKNVPAPLSAFRDIEQLRAGELAVCTGGDVERQRWWRVEFRQRPDTDEREAAGQIRALLEDSVRLQMRSTCRSAPTCWGANGSRPMASRSRLRRAVLPYSARADAGPQGFRNNMLFMVVLSTTLLIDRFIRSRPNGPEAATAPRLRVIRPMRSRPREVFFPPFADRRRERRAPTVVPLSARNGWTRGASGFPG